MSEAPGLTTVNIRPDVGILSVLRHLNYRPWYAMAEFVDNAFESYRQHYVELRDVEGDIPDRTGSALDALLAQEHVELAHAALARLDRECRDLVYLHAGMQKSYREIAELLGATEGALRVRLHRCVRHAREALRALMSAQIQGRDDR